MLSDLSGRPGLYMTRTSTRRWLGSPKSPGLWLTLAYTQGVSSEWTTQWGVGASNACHLTMTQRNSPWVLPPNV